jgi:hypothetical protein
MTKKNFRKSEREKIIMMTLKIFFLKIEIKKKFGDEFFFENKNK